MSEYPWLEVITAIYIACCLACRHTAVRLGRDGAATCDWCSIAKSETVWRFEHGRLVIPALQDR